MIAQADRRTRSVRGKRGPYRRVVLALRMLLPLLPAGLVGQLPPGPAAPSTGTAAPAEPTDDLRILITPDVAAAWGPIAEAFEREHGIRLRTLEAPEPDGRTADPRARLEADGVPDLVFLPIREIEALAAAGTIASETATTLAWTELGAAVPSGHPHPDLSTLDGFRLALLQADAVAFPGGPSGSHLSGHVFSALGIADEMGARALLTEEVAGALVQGHAEIGLQQVSRLLAAEGIEFVAPLPAAVQERSYYAAAVAAGTPQGEAARQLLAWLASPEADALLLQGGLGRSVLARP